ncbi:hypothetical protein HOK51_01645 [Candidatus Woesearchaeota archaeon]|jgi:hypothetical protein|nr:hypothetical protein [Candidatus Woesearchaeota archaeon]MBT6518518.1 hypothetical protein [Candidatus Woesearchaeota archaeon]MBT7368390.1 hypothetical protein [Candidatus Woesearchaeota archaeon]
MTDTINGTLDLGIEQLVHTLNKIPFITTQASCEGHLADKCFGVYAEPNRKMLYGGDMIFKVNSDNPKANDFLDELKSLEQKYHFVDLDEHHCGNPDCSIEDSMCFVFDQHDLTQIHTLTDEDDLKTSMKKSFQVKPADGIQRIKEYASVWKEFLEIANKYL